MSGAREEALRALARDIAARCRAQADRLPARQEETTTAVLVHVSHRRFALQPAAGGACLIEPAVPCTHCGYCQSYGH